MKVDLNQVKKVKPLFVALAVMVIAAVVIGVIALAAGLKSNTIIKYPSTQEYVAGQGNIKGNVDTAKWEAMGNAFAIGANKDGYAVFKDPKAAFDEITKQCADGIALIKKEYGLNTLTNSNYDAYGRYGWQTGTGTAEEKSQAMLISQFFDLYENSYKKQ